MTYLSHKKILFVLSIALLIAVFMGCSNREAAGQLETISRMADENPKSALAMLKQYEQEVPHWSKRDRMHYELVKLKSQNKADVVFSSDSIAKQVAEYYSRKGTDNERMLAYYLLGRVYSDMGEAPQALQAFYDAIECADTLSSDCDYDVLITVYGQMSLIFDKQNLPNDEIWALRHYIDYIRKNDSEKEYVISREQLINPYYQLGEKDSVLAIINDTYTSLKKLGEDKEAADALVASVYIYIERGQLDEARQVIDIFEKESGLFDAQGNIEKGRENYYYIRGAYELETNKLDAAEKDFRRALSTCFTPDVYKGLLTIYHQKNNVDSVMHFAVLLEQALDSIHNKMQIDAIHQMSSLYNYSRSQKLAEQEARNARKARLWSAVILSVVVMGLLLTYKLYLSYKKKKQEEIDSLVAALSNAKNEYQTIHEELQKLNEKDFERLIAEKEQKEKELKETIEQLETVVAHSTFNDNLETFANSEIVDALREKDNLKLDNHAPNKSEWSALEQQFSKDMPATYNLLKKQKRLSPRELQVCMLIFAGFDDTSVCTLTSSIPQTVTKVKSRSNMKLFNEKGAHGLKKHLFNMVKPL